MYAVVWHVVVPIVAVLDKSETPKWVPLKVTIVPAVAGELLRSTMDITGASYENSWNPVPTCDSIDMIKVWSMPSPVTPEQIRAVVATHDVVAQYVLVKRMVGE